MKNLVPAALYVQYHVIFIHGLKGDVATSWISSHAAMPFDGPAELQSGLLQTSVWKFNYSSNWKISDIANILIGEIRKLQLKQSAKIVFATHCLGGIVVKIMIRMLYELPESSSPMATDLRFPVFLVTPLTGNFLQWRPNQA